MALPAFLFVETFRRCSARARLRRGRDGVDGRHGLIPEAVREAPAQRVAAVAVASTLAMVVLQVSLL